MEIHTIGIDLGKTVFHLVGLNARTDAWRSDRTEVFGRLRASRYFRSVRDGAN